MNVELRKVKKEDQLTKRRNLNRENTCSIEDGINVEDIIKGYNCLESRNNQSIVLSFNKKALKAAMRPRKSLPPTQRPLY